MPITCTRRQFASLCDAMVEYHHDQKAPFRRAVEDHLAIAKAIRDGMPSVWEPGPPWIRGSQEMADLFWKEPWRNRKANRQWIANAMKLRAAQRQLEHHEGEIKKWEELRR